MLRLKSFQKSAKWSAIYFQAEIRVETQRKRSITFSVYSLFMQLMKI